jgi:hypothetical protein
MYAAVPQTPGRNRRERAMFADARAKGASTLGEIIIDTATGARRGAVGAVAGNPAGGIDPTVWSLFP